MMGPSQEMEAHPHSAVVELKMLAPDLGIALRTVPGGEVGAAAIMSAHEVLTVGRERAHLSRPALGRPDVAAAQLLENPGRKSLRVRFAVVSDKRVKLGILEGLFVEACREGLELGEADVLDEAARGRVGGVRLTDDVQWHALRRH